MKWLKRVLILILVLIILALIGLRAFMYKAQHGIASYETDIPQVTFPTNKPALLLFSKTTAFRHGEAIEASKEMFKQLARDNDWFIYETEKGGIFNEEQLAQFDAVIWNNSTGPVLNDAQRMAFQTYIEQGGGYVGIHGAGDFSHDWEWYTNQLIGASFSHHPIENHIQKSTVFLSEKADTLWNTPPVWTQSDEWYIFHDSPKSTGADIVYFIDGTTIDPNGNMLWIRGKDFGMGKRHPVVWTKEIENGRAFYTSMGHTGESYSNQNFITILEKGIYWAADID